LLNEAAAPPQLTVDNAAGALLASVLRWQPLLWRSEEAAHGGRLWFMGAQVSWLPGKG
jgi:hypothetical protein